MKYSEIDKVLSDNFAYITLVLKSCSTEESCDITSKWAKRVLLSKELFFSKQLALQECLKLRKRIHLLILELAEMYNLQIKLITRNQRMS